LTKGGFKIAGVKSSVVDPELFVRSGSGSESGTFFVKKYDRELLEKADPDPAPWQKVSDPQH
jgi:hypothetical protein